MDYLHLWVPTYPDTFMIHTILLSTSPYSSVKVLAHLSKEPGVATYLKV